MKTLLKIITPTISTIGIATIVSCGCNPNSDGLVAIPKQYLNIVDEGKTLKGLKNPTESIPEQYKKITVPKEITKVYDFLGTDQSATPAYYSITKIDYESGSNWESIGVDGAAFTNLANLTTIVFPPKLKEISFKAIAFCDKLDTLDISNVENLDILNVDTIWAYKIAAKGKLIVAKDKTDIGTSILNKQGLTDWTVEEKK